uniref:Uncharacterized protein n=1 Tax=uncultured marine virus TaxID=186617 RepID=A0A0F7L2N0_9VIRU|nr:hypothetical protein [uncultured marine virus]
MTYLIPPWQQPTTQPSEQTTVDPLRNGRLATLLAATPEVRAEEQREREARRPAKETEKAGKPD